MNNSVKQQQILDFGLDQDLLVNAGAGSGKTTVLTKKVIKHLTSKDPKQHLDPSELLVLTFTNNAAHEMKTRIIDAVNELTSDDEQEKKTLELLKNAINSAHIQTFDSFAQEIVKEYAYKLDMPNTIFIANKFVLEAFKIQKLNEIFQKRYESGNQNFVNFLSRYNSRDDKKTKQVVLDLFDRLSKYTPSKKQVLINKILSFNSKEQFVRWAKEYTSLLYEEEEKEIASLTKQSAIKARLAQKDTKIRQQVGDINQEYERYAATYKDITILLQLCKELEDALDKYKEETHTYTYADIANKALYLLHDESIASAIRNKFKYIMVDEYQDTNDLQKEVIDILLAKKDNGQDRNHLFAVGDPKQSIYGFRDANLNIFRQTESNLKPNGVIYMDDNFRSFGNVIDDINTIFKKYMTFNHGGIDYTQPGQSLTLPSIHKDFYNDNYGLHILTTNKEEDILTAKAANIKQWEAKAIIQDINKKMDKNDPYLVWDQKENNGKGGYRPCQYKDFYILARTKSNYAMYEREFIKAGIELNNKISTNLVEVNAIMLINSLIKALSLIESNDNSYKAKEQKKHIFASIARSYIYKDKYTDQMILDKLNDGLYLNDDIFIKLEKFYKNNKNKPFSQMLIQLLDEFEINAKLYLIGEIEKNAAKIESLYQLIIAIEQSGGLIKDFSDLLDIISKNSIDLEYESVTDLENAVTLMTIHQSKGLQNKIIYLPNTVNHLGGQSALDKPDYDFDEEFGILLPIYNMEDYRNDPKNSEEYPKGSQIYSLPYKLFRKRNKNESKEIDEHVRLFYVALTRAEQAIYIVGYPKCREDKDGVYTIVDKNKETLFHMLSYVYGNKKVFPWYKEDAFPEGKWIKVDLTKIKPIAYKSFDFESINDDPIEFKIRTRNKASQLKIRDEEIASQRISTGDDLHAIMERTDFNNPNLDFIANKDYKNTISKVLNMDLFKKDLKGATFYPEYEYYDDIFHNTGYIDLLAISKDGIYYIIDYKLFNIDKKEYEKQLHIYQRNIQRIFNADKSKIKLILVSLEKQEMKIVECEG